MNYLPSAVTRTLPKAGKAVILGVFSFFTRTRMYMRLRRRRAASPVAWDCARGQARQSEFREQKLDILLFVPVTLAVAVAVFTVKPQQHVPDCSTQSAEITAVHSAIIDSMDQFERIERQEIENCVKYRMWVFGTQR